MVQAGIFIIFLTIAITSYSKDFETSLKKTKALTSVIKNEEQGRDLGDKKSNPSYQDSQIIFIKCELMCRKKRDDFIEYKIGHIDKEEKNIRLFKNVRPGCFQYGLAEVKLRDKWGLISEEGKKLTAFQYESIKIISNERIMVKYMGKWGFINSQGRDLSKMKYDHMKEDFTEGFLKVVINKKCGYLNQKYKESISIKYDYCGKFNNGRAIVGSNGKYGFINSKGEEIIPLKFDQANPFENESALVTYQGSIVKIDKSGRFIANYL